MTALDTNVLIYACDKADQRRQQIALSLITRSVDSVLLWQVACEFIAAPRKLKDQGFTPVDAWSRLDEFRGVFRLVPPSAAVFPRAQDLHLNHSVSFWNALIVGTCLENAVQTLYSVDIPSSDGFGSLKIVNPFA